jgi:Domain of unknown function (DUF4349)
MDRFEDDTELIAELRSLRPAPEPKFAAALDERAAAGFPRRSPVGSRIGGLLARLRTVPPRRIVAPAGATALAAIVVATAIVSVNESDDGGLHMAPDDRGGNATQRVHPSGTRAAAPTGVESSDSATSAAEMIPSGGEGVLSPGGAGVTITGGRERAVERSAEIILATDPSRVADDAAKVFDAVRAHDGIVMRSTIRDGAQAGAEFDLLIPSGKLGDAMASFSSIAEVRSRREATADITAATVGVGELVRDSRARIEGLLGQLAEATTTGEREAVETELGSERRRLAHLRSRFANLQRRANFSRVSLRIEAASASGGASWGIGDALDDAGHILAVAAAVT